jgi:predicted amidohydrolase
VNSLTVTLLEVPARFGAVREQLRWVDDALVAQPPGAVTLLPELSLTGWVTPQGTVSVEGFDEPVDGPTAQALASLAVKHQTCLVGPLVEREGLSRFNTMVGFDAQGARVLHYRKRHPWYPETWATAGELPWPRLTVGGVRFTLATCFDVHFLAEEAAEVLAEVDALLFPSGWVDEEDSLPGHLVALSERFGLTVLNANWGVGVPAVQGQGGSLVVRPGSVQRRSGAARLDVSVHGV